MNMFTIDNSEFTKAINKSSVCLVASVIDGFLELDPLSANVDSNPESDQNTVPEHHFQPQFNHGWHIK